MVRARQVKRSQGLGKPRDLAQGRPCEEDRIAPDGEGAAFVCVVVCYEAAPPCQGPGYVGAAMGPHDIPFKSTKSYG